MPSVLVQQCRAMSGHVFACTTSTTESSNAKYPTRYCWCETSLVFLHDRLRRASTHDSVALWKDITIWEVTIYNTVLIWLYPKAFFRVVISWLRRYFKGRCRECCVYKREDAVVESRDNLPSNILEPLWAPHLGQLCVRKWGAFRRPS